MGGFFMVFICERFAIRVEPSSPWFSHDVFDPIFVGRGGGADCDDLAA